MKISGKYQGSNETRFIKDYITKELENIGVKRIEKPTSRNSKTRRSDVEDKELLIIK